MARHRDWDSICSAMEHVRVVTPGAVRATVVVFDDRSRSEEPFLDLNRQLNQHFCDSHGFDFVFVGGPEWAQLSDMPPHWARVAHLLELARLHQENPDDFLLSLDSDAVLANECFALERLLTALPREKSVFLAKDPPMWPPPTTWETTGVYCSGFVLVRLDSHGRDFLARWTASFDPLRWWQSEEGRWTTDGNWAGQTYEQGQLNRLAQGEFKDLVLELPQALFNSSFARPLASPQPVVLHLMRRPGEHGHRAKQDRVAATFAALLGLRAGSSRGGGSGSRGNSTKSSNDGTFAGIPCSGQALQAWEEEEERWTPAADLWCAFVSPPSVGKNKERRLQCTGCSQTMEPNDVVLYPGGDDGEFCELGRWFCKRCWSDCTVGQAFPQFRRACDGERCD